MMHNSDSDEVETRPDGGLELGNTSMNTLEVVEGCLFSILVGVLGGDGYVLPTSAAQQINALFLQSWDNNTDSVYEIRENFLKLLWHMVITLIEQTPHTHAAQRTLVHLILELQKIPEDEARIASGNLILPWKQLCGLNSSMEEYLRYNGIFGRFVDAQTVESWTNLHAFTATLFGRGLMHWRYIGIMVFHDTLEQNSTGKNQEANIQAMAQWIRHAGEAMFLTLRQREPISNLHGVGTTGELYWGEAGFCPERWSFWIKQVFKLAQVAPEHLRPLVLSSAHRMVDISVLGAASLM